MFFITVGAYLQICKAARPICLTLQELMSFVYQHVRLFVCLASVTFEKYTNIPIKVESTPSPTPNIKSYARGNTTV